MISLRSEDPVFQRVIEEGSPAGARKFRETLIRKIQEITKRRVIVYIASSNHPMPNIMPQDVPIFEDMLRVASNDTKADLVINSPGGDPNTAEKILMMCRTRFKEEFNVIVPNFAKSAATMIALGSDKIFMGYLSELGPIDPQVPIPLPTGQVQYVPARTYLDGLERIRQWIAEGHPPQVYLPILSQIRPEMIKFCEDAIDFSKEFLKKWLPKGTLKYNQEKVDEVVEAFVSGTKYKSHGQVINYEEAKKLGLNVEFVEPQSELWNLVWELYVRSTHFLSQTKNAAKLFETDTSSITMNIEVVPVQARTSNQ